MVTARAGHAAVLLRDGRVLLAGGSLANGTATQAAEIYNPSTGTWSATGNMTVPRSGFALVVLLDGTVLAVGGSTASGVTPTAELYEPATGTWSATGAMSTGRFFGSRDGQAARLSDGAVLVVSGDADGPHASSEIYEPANGAWTPPVAMPTTQCVPAVALLPDDRILTTGGTDCTSPPHTITTTQIYQPEPRR